MASDAFFPFKDNIEVANKYGVKYITQPGGSIRDNDVIDECNKNDILMAKCEKINYNFFPAHFPI